MAAPKKVKGYFVEFLFSRKDDQGAVELKPGLVDIKEVVAFEPGSADGVTHLHLKSGAKLVVSEPLEQVSKKL